MAKKDPKNLAEGMDEGKLRQIGEESYQAFTKDRESRQQFDMKRKIWHELYYQTHTPESPPWSGASEESIPVLAESCNSYQSRAYKAFFPSRDFVQAIPGNSKKKEEVELAERIGKHMSYQLGVNDRRYKKDKLAMFLSTAKEGSDFTKTWYDPLKKRPVIRRVRIDDLIVPYGVGPRELEDIDRISEICRLSMNKSKILAKSGYFTKPLKQTRLDEGSDGKQQAEDHAQGMSEQDPYGTTEMGIAIEQHRLLNLKGDEGISYPFIVTFDHESKEVLRIERNYLTNKDGKPLDEERKRIETYTHYSFLTNPDGFYGLGYGHLIGQLNIAINKMLRQGIDASTLANFGNMSGFISDNLGVKGDQLELEIGKFIKLPRAGDDIRKAIYQFQFPGANPSHMKLLQDLPETAQRVGNTTDPVTGDVQKVLQPLTVMTLLESSLQLPTSVMEQQSIAFEEELEKIYKLNRLYLPDKETYYFGGDMHEIAKKDYENEMKVVPIMDPRMITKQQKIAKAQQQYQFVMEDPELSQDAGVRREAHKDYLNALETEDMERFLPEEPEVKRFDDQVYENMLFMLPPDKREVFTVHPDQDHAQHIRITDALIATLNDDIDPDTEIVDEVTMQVVEGVGDEMKAGIIAELMQHRMEHIAYQYGIETGVLEREEGRLGKLVPLESNSMDIDPSSGKVISGANAQDMLGEGLEEIPGPGGDLELFGEPGEIEEPAGVTGQAGIEGEE